MPPGMKAPPRKDCHPPSTTKNSQSDLSTEPSLETENDNNPKSSSLLETSPKQTNKHSIKVIVNNRQ